MLATLLRLTRFPWCTTLSVLTTVGFVATVVHEAVYLNGNPNVGIGPRLAAPWNGPHDAALGVSPCAALGVGLSLVWGTAAHFRGERWGGRIAGAGIALQVAAAVVFNGAAYPRESGRSRQDPA